MGIEIISSMIVTLLIVEKVIDKEKKRFQSQFARFDHGALCNSLAKLVFFAYVRLFRGEKGDINLALMNINDARLEDLYIFWGEVGSDKMVSLIKEMEGYSFQDYVLAIENGEHPYSFQEREDEIADRFNAYDKETRYIRRDLLSLIDRAIFTSSNVKETKMLYWLRDLVDDHEAVLVGPLRDKFEATDKCLEILNKLNLMVELYTNLESVWPDMELSQNV